MKHNTKLYLIIVALVGVIFWRECIHAQREYNHIKAFAETQDNCVVPVDMRCDYSQAYQAGFNACMEQF